MDTPSIVILSLALIAAIALGTAALIERRRGAATPHDVGEAVNAAVMQAVLDVRQQASAERDAAIQAALAHAAMLGREQLGATTAAAQADLAAKKDVIDTRLDQVQQELRGELQRLGQMVRQIGESSSERFGQVDASLRSHAQVAATLADSTRSLREALANPKARGQWGERMAEDVLRLAGFSENVNYVKQTKLTDREGVPDYTFQLPKGHVLYMDVKFPLAAYLRYIEATTDTDRAAHLQTFLRDVRLRVKELAGRHYAAPGGQPTVDYVLLFMPNEQLTGFIHEHDAELIDHAMGQHVVLCSPLTLFALLGVIRQAFDNFMVEQTSDEILRLLGSFAGQWSRFTDALDTVKKRLDTTQKGLDEVLGTRRRALERPLRELDALRQERNLAAAGELFPTDTLALDGLSEDRAPSPSQLDQLLDDPAP
jgi:DNA recombination protein RmuC